MIQDNLFNYKRFVFLKWALLLTLISSFAYLFDQNLHLVLWLYF